MKPLLALACDICTMLRKLATVTNWLSPRNGLVCDIAQQQRNSFLGPGLAAVELFELLHSTYVVITGSPFRGYRSERRHRLHDGMHALGPALGLTCERPARPLPDTDGFQGARVCSETASTQTR